MEGLKRGGEDLGAVKECGPDEDLGEVMCGSRIKPLAIVR